MNLLSRLGELSRQDSDKTAIVYQEDMLTYGQLWQTVVGFASGLRKLGLSQGGRVLVMLGNSPEFVISYYGIIAAGGIIVPVNPIYTAQEIGIILADADPFAIVTSEKLAPLIESALLANNMPSRPVILIRTTDVSKDNFYAFDDLIKTQENEGLDLNQEEDRVIEFLYTSGTTGLPKGAMLTHENLYSNTKTFAIETEMSSKDCALLSAPAYHAAAQTCLMNNTLYAGGTLVIHDGWQGAEAVLKSFQDDKITFFFGPPTMYTFIVNSPAVKNYDCSSLRVAFTGAASLPAEIFRRFSEIFGFEIMEGYGLSETSPVVTTNPLRGTKKTASIGIAFPGVKVKIFSPEDEEVPCGEIGEIVVQGPNVMKGYYNRPEETAHAMRNGWFHTGDLAYMDEEGYVFIVDRIKDLIIRGGMNIYPREVEELLYTHPAILESAVIGVPDDVMGEEVKAFIVLKDGIPATEQEIREFCKDKLAKYKVPKFIEFVPTLPKTTTGKTLKRELRKQ
jgi:long-chain acyl-CoA synthetase